MGRTLGRLGIAVGVFAVTFIVVDAVVVPRLVAADRPSAYSRSDYWGAQFSAEATVAADLRSTRQTLVGPVEMSSDFEGRYITVEDGLRRTVPEPASARRRVAVFGGSTTFCVEVPDELTWPSQLARRIVDREIRVINVGLSGASFADRVSAFEGLGLTRPGDVAVFFVGANDAVIGSQKNEVVGPLARWPRLRRAVELTLGWTNAGRLALKRSQQLLFQIEGTSREAVDRFRGSLDEVERAAEERGVRILVVLQPSELVAAEPGWAASGQVVDERFRTAFRDFYADALRAPDIRGRIVDGTNAFSRLDESPYLDFVHVQEDGNRAIADFVYAELERRGWLD